MIEHYIFVWSSLFSLFVQNVFFTISMFIYITYNMILMLDLCTEYEEILVIKREVYMLIPDDIYVIFAFLTAIVL